MSDLYDSLLEKDAYDKPQNLKFDEKELGIHLIMT